ncbi:MAG: hypothetical protein MMC33_010518 [Icmadophila ericetorum]|nr:hypothetical protein [Icmadophila ericetorum]
MSGMGEGNERQTVRTAGDMMSMGVGLHSILAEAGPVRAEEDFERTENEVDEEDEEEEEDEYEDEEN